MADKARVGAAVTALIAAVKTAMAAQATALCYAGSAVGTMTSLLDAAFNAHFTVTAPLIYALAASAAAAGAGRMIYKAAAALGAMALFINCAIHAHMAVFAEVTGAVCAGVADNALIGVILYKARATFLAGYFILKMTDKAGISAAAAALISAVKTAVADKTAAFGGAGSAVGAMIALFDGAFNAHFAIIAPLIYTLAASAAVTGARRMVYKAAATFLTMALFVNGAFNAHMAVFAEFIHTVAT